MEIWDIYNSKKEKTGKQICRGESLPDDEFHLVINAWIKNDKGQFLITQRAPNKSFPLMWECTGGSALAGENGLQTAIREIKEELGLELDGKTARLVGSTLRYFKGCPDILEVYMFKCNSSLEEIKIQKEEVINVMWASKAEILKLYNDNMFEANSFFMDAICT